MSGIDGTSRRGFLVRAAGAVGGGIATVAARDLVRVPAAAAAPKPTINPRSAWGGDLKPKGPLPAEKPGDVKFLLVHHTAGANGYARDEVRQTLRRIFSYHTGAKGWNDVAYNFFVDAYGGIWEGRQGSLEAPVMGSATGGSQGFALLCCFMGDHQKTPPTGAALAAMSDLLAWLAGTYGIDLAPGARATFVSRGSNLHAAGKTVTTPTIATHRDMSKTTCPGDACYRLVKAELAPAAAAKAGAGSPSAATVPPISVEPAATPTTFDAAVALPPASPTQIEEDNPLPPATTALPPDSADARGTVQDGNPSSTGRVLGIGGLGATAAIAAAVVLRRRRSRAAAESRWYTSELLNPPDDESVPPPAGHGGTAVDAGEAALVPPGGRLPD